MTANRMKEYYFIALVLLVLLAAFRVYRCECKQLQLRKDNRALQTARFPNDMEAERQQRGRRQSGDAVCRDIFIGSSVTITSPGFPDNVDDNIQCQWLVIADEEPVILRFDFIASEERGILCPNELNGWIFRDGSDPRGVRLFPDCPQNDSPKVRGISSVITIIFNSDLWVSSRAFSIVLDRSASPVTTKSDQITNPPSLSVASSDGNGHSNVVNRQVVNEEDGDDDEEEVTDDNSGFLQCFFQETSPSGVITSPEYPEKVEGPICTWIITAFSSEVIHLTFTDIDINGKTDSDGDCDEKFSNLKVTTFDQNFNKMEEYYCERESRDSIVHNSHENLWIEFRSNFGFSRFSARYTSTPENMVTTDSSLDATNEVTGIESGQECNLVLHDSTGVIQTPNFPSPYSPNLFCVWTILTFPDRLIRLKFNQFDIDGPITGVGKCDISMAHKYSFVKISYYSVNGSLIDETFCGPDSPDVLVSNANRLSIYFQSGHGIGDGFQATYTALSRQQLRGFGRSFDNFDFGTDCVISMNETSGNITYSFNREETGETCIWNIQPIDTSSLIVLTIQTLIFTSDERDGDNCEDSPPVKIEGFSHVDGEFVTWPLCDNITDTFPLYISQGQLNVTLNVTLWKIVIFDAHYKLRGETELVIEMSPTAHAIPETDMAMSTQTVVPLDGSKEELETQETPLHSTRIGFEETSFCQNLTSYAMDGWINVQGYPISSNSLCTWTLVSSSVRWLWLSFSEFNMQTTGNISCNPSSNIGSSLSVFLTNDTFSNISAAKPVRYGIFCGALNPGLIFLIAKEVRLVLRDFDSLYRDFKLFYSWESYSPTEVMPNFVTNEYATIVLDDIAKAGDALADRNVLETKPPMAETTLSTSPTQHDDVSVLSTALIIGPEFYQIQGGSTTLNTQDDSSSTVSAARDKSTMTSMRTINNDLTKRVTKEVDSDLSSVAEKIQMTSAPTGYQTEIILNTLGETDAVTDIFTEIIEEEEEYVTIEKSVVQMSSISPHGFHHEDVTKSCEYRIKEIVGFGRIESPDYPSSAPSGSKCMWILQFERETILKILFTEFELFHIEGQKCELQTTRLRITAWSDQDIEVERLYFCGDYYPKYIAIQGKTIVIQFWSNPDRADSNLFRLHYFTKRSHYRGLFDGFDNSSVTPTIYQSKPTKDTKFPSEVSDFVDGDLTAPSVTVSSTHPNVTDRRALPESETQFRLTVFICTGVALVLLGILLVLLIFCIRNRNRSSALTLGPEFAAPGDYWSNYRQWARTDYPSSVKPHYDAGLPSTSMHPGHVRPVEQERLV